MVDIWHFLWVHEILQSPRRGFMEAKCRPCPFNLVWDSSAIRARKPEAWLWFQYTVSSWNMWETLRMQRKFKISLNILEQSRDNRLYGNHHSRRAGYDQASEEVDYRLDMYHNINETTRWDIGYLIVYLDQNLSYNSSLNILLNLFQSWPLNPGSSSVEHPVCQEDKVFWKYIPVVIVETWVSVSSIEWQKIRFCSTLVPPYRIGVCYRCISGTTRRELMDRMTSICPADTSEWPATGCTMWCEARPPTWVKALRHLPRYSAHTHRTCLLPLPARQYRPAAPERECTDSESVTSLYITSGQIKVSFYVEE